MEWKAKQVLTNFRASKGFEREGSETYGDFPKKLRPIFRWSPWIAVSVGLALFLPRSHAEEGWISEFRQQGLSADLDLVESQHDEVTNVPVKGDQSQFKRGLHGDVSPTGRQLRSTELCQEADSQLFQVEVEQGGHRALGGEFRLKIRNRSDRNLNVAIAMRVLDAAGRERIPLQSTAAKSSKKGEELRTNMKLGRAFQQIPNGYYAVEFTSLGVDEEGEITARSRVYVQMEDGEARFVDYGEWYFGSGHDSHGHVVKE